ncbi:MAG TPA: DUF3499 domain-containing protein [Frankiaceae bacterium]|nr:DUF3499 domain-containing protein [Frankiaceae bacterium]
MPRRCSRAACSSGAVATLTYAYVESTAVLGPLSPFVEPHSYDLCAEHADRLTVPRGWAVVRVEGETAPQPPSNDDLEALADAVREAARPAPAPQASVPGVRSRGHLRVLPRP